MTYSVIKMLIGWLGAKLGLFLLIQAFSLFLNGSMAAPPPPKEKSKESQPSQPAAPQPAPSFPVFPGGGGGGGGGPMPTPIPPPPVRSQPSGGGGSAPPIKFFTAKKKNLEPDHPRPTLFIGKNDRGIRSAPLMRTSQEELLKPPGPPGSVTDEYIILETLKREAQNDALIAKHEYENDLNLIEINKRLHAQNEMQFKKKVIPRQTFEESRTKLIRSQYKAQETRNRIDEFLAEVSVDELRLLKVAGQTIPMADIAQAYVNVWKARLGRVKAAEGAAQAQYNFLYYTYGLNKILKEKGAESEDNVIKAQRDAEEAAIVLKLAKTLVAQNQKNLDDAIEVVKKAHDQDAQTEIKPSF